MTLHTPLRTSVQLEERCLPETFAGKLFSLHWTVLRARKKLPLVLKIIIIKFIMLNMKFKNGLPRK